MKEKIQKQKLLQRLKVEKGKDLHRGMAWDQQGSVISGDLVQDRILVEQQEEEEEAGRSHEQDEEDRYSTSTASGKIYCLDYIVSFMPHLSHICIFFFFLRCEVY